MQVRASSFVRNEYHLPGSTRNLRSVDSPATLTFRTFAKGWGKSPAQPEATFRVLDDAFRARQLKDRRNVARSAAATEAEPIAFTRTDVGEPEEEDFYSILGVVSSVKHITDHCRLSFPADLSFLLHMQPFNANDGQIKKAYYAMMRECHPDLSQDEESLEFSTVINEIYEVFVLLSQ